VIAVEVRRAGVDEWPAVRDTRLAALADSPSAFGSTLQREVTFDDRDWRRRVEGGNWFLAWRSDQGVGIAAGVREDDRPDERQLVAMWVAPEHRGTLVADQLVAAVCAWAQDQGAQSVTLWVADGNARARRFYERLGFRSTGQRQPLPSAPQVGEERMERTLGPSARS
jgi:GNAT superfamily N-acetyltransferase